LLVLCKTSNVIGLHFHRHSPGPVTITHRHTDKCSFTQSPAYLSFWMGKTHLIWVEI